MTTCAFCQKDINDTLFSDLVVRGRCSYIIRNGSIFCDDNCYQDHREEKGIEQLEAKRQDLED